MNDTDYWPMAREYSLWNAAVSALQFWQQSDEVLFTHFVTTLNAAFESKLALEDEGYENGSENVNIPTSLRRTS